MRNSICKIYAKTANFQVFLSKRVKTLHHVIILNRVGFLLLVNLKYGMMVEPGAHFKNRSFPFAIIYKNCIGVTKKNAGEKTNTFISQLKS